MWARGVICCTNEFDSWQTKIVVLEQKTDLLKEIPGNVQIDILQGGRRNLYRLHSCHETSVIYKVRTLGSGLPEYWLETFCYWTETNEKSTHTYTESFYHWGMRKATSCSASLELYSWKLPTDNNRNGQAGKAPSPHCLALVCTVVWGHRHMARKINMHHASVPSYCCLRLQPEHINFWLLNTWFHFIIQYVIIWNNDCNNEMSLCMGHKCNVRLLRSGVNNAVEYWNVFKVNGAIYCTKHINGCFYSANKINRTWYRLLTSWARCISYALAIISKVCDGKAGVT